MSNHFSDTKTLSKKLIVIVGATSVGKTEIALAIAEHFNTSIISADSRQCFKELKIGVARPDEFTLQAVPHFFIASHSVNENISVSGFEKYCLEKLHELFLKNHVVVMAGGSGLYVNAVTNGLDKIPDIPNELAEEIEKQYQQNGLKFLQTEIEKFDKKYFAEGEIKNPHRLMRALAVAKHTGKSILDFHSKEKKERNFSVIKIGLELPREILYERINLRVDDMIKNDLVDEAKNVFHLKHLRSLQTVGYQELFDFFEGKINLDGAISLIKQNTRHYAKRQITWFKKDKEIVWFNPEEKNKILEFLKSAD